MEHPLCCFLSSSCCLLLQPVGDGLHTGELLLTFAGVTIVCHARVEGDFGAVLLEPPAAVGPHVPFLISPCTLLNSWTRECVPSRNSLPV